MDITDIKLRDSKILWLICLFTFYLWSRDSSVGRRYGGRMVQVSNPSRGNKFFFFFKWSRLTMANPPSCLTSPGFLRWGYSCQDVKFTTHLYLAPAFRTSGAIHPLPHTPSWVLFICIKLWPFGMFIYHFVTVVIRDRDSSVGIATRYGLDSPGIESRWGRVFPHPSTPALGPAQPPIQWVPGLYRG